MTDNERDRIKYDHSLADFFRNEGVMPYRYTSLSPNVIDNGFTAELFKTDKTSIFISRASTANEYIVEAWEEERGFFGNKEFNFQDDVSDIKEYMRMLKKEMNEMLWKRGADNFVKFMEDSGFKIIEKDFDSEKYSIHIAELENYTGGEYAYFPHYLDKKRVQTNIMFVPSQYQEDVFSAEIDLSNIYKATEQYNKQFYYDLETPINQKIIEFVMEDIKSKIIDFFSEDMNDDFLNSTEFYIHELYPELEDIMDIPDYKNNLKYKELQVHNHGLVATLSNTLSLKGFDPEFLYSINEDWWIDSETEVGDILSIIQKRLLQYNIMPNRSLAEDKSLGYNVDIDTKRIEKNVSISDAENTLKKQFKANYTLDDINSYIKEKNISTRDVSNIMSLSCHLLIDCSKELNLRDKKNPSLVISQSAFENN